MDKELMLEYLKLSEDKKLKLYINNPDNCLSCFKIKEKLQGDCFICSICETIYDEIKK